MDKVIKKIERQLELTKNSNLQIQDTILNLKDQLQYAEFELNENLSLIIEFNQALDLLKSNFNEGND